MCTLIDKGVQEWNNFQCQLMVWFLNRKTTKNPLPEIYNFTHIQLQPQISIFNTFVCDLYDKICQICLLSLGMASIKKPSSFYY